MISSKETPTSQITSYLQLEKMLSPVWPSLFFWYILGLFSSCLWLFTSEEMQFIQRATGPLAAVLLLTIALSWFISNIVFAVLFRGMLGITRTERLFRGYERVGKIIGYVILLFGNIGLYFFSEKSIPCLLTFLSLSLHCLCVIFFLQPHTDFGVLDFLLSASLNQSLSLFRLRDYSWIVFAICAMIASLRYCLLVKSSTDSAEKTTGTGGAGGEVPAVEKKNKSEHRIRLDSEYDGGDGHDYDDDDELPRSVRDRYMKNTPRHFKKLLAKKSITRQRSI